MPQEGIPQVFQSGHVLLDVLLLLLDITARRDDEHLDHHRPGLAVTLGDLEEPCAAKVLGEPDLEVRVQVLAQGARLWSGFRESVSGQCAGRVPQARVQGEWFR